MEVPAQSRGEPARVIGSDGIGKKPSTSGFMAKVRARKEAAAAAEKEAAAEREAAAREGGTGMGQPLGAPVLSNMGPPTPKGKGPMEPPPGLRLPEAASYEAGINSGSDYTADSEETERAWQVEWETHRQAGVDATPQMEGGTGAAAASPAPGLAPPMPGSGAAAVPGEMEVEGTQGATEAAPETMVETRPPVEEPEEVLTGAKEQAREELWAIASVLILTQGERTDELFGRFWEPPEAEDSGSLTGESEGKGGDDEEGEGGNTHLSAADAQLERDYEEGRREGFQELGPVKMSTEDMDALEVQTRKGMARSRHRCEWSQRCQRWQG